MSSQPTLVEVELRRALDEERRYLDEQAIDDLLAGPEPASSRIQGLASALAAGPGRNTAEARLAAVAAYLAGQSSRMGKGEDLWGRVQEQIGALEAKARHLVAEATGDRSPEKTDPDLCRRTHLRLVEIYMHLLMRRAGQPFRTGCRKEE
jgi:hypothetical protein